MDLGDLFTRLELNEVLLHLRLRRARQRLALSLPLLQEWWRCFPDCLLHSHDLLWDPHLLPGGGNWAVPWFGGDDLSRTTLPNAQRCGNCHNDGGGFSWTSTTASSLPGPSSIPSQPSPLCLAFLGPPVRDGGIQKPASRDLRT